MKRFLNKKTLIFLIVIGVVGGFFALKKSNGHIEIETYAVSGHDVVKSVTASGETVAKKDLIVRTDSSALVEEIYFESGDSVEEGDVILKLDESSLKSSSDSALASYLGAKASYETLNSQIAAAEKSVKDTKFKLERAQNEYDGTDTSADKQALNTAQYNYDYAVSSLESLVNSEDSLKQSMYSYWSAYVVAKRSYDNSGVVAPESGFLALDDIERGSLLTKGQKMFEISSVDGIEFVAEVDETDISQIQVGQIAEVELDGYEGQIFDGSVRNIDAQTTVNSSGVTVIEVTIEFTAQNIHPIIGMNGSADIITLQQSSGKTIPFDSILYDDDDNTYVYVINGEFVEKRMITVAVEGDEYAIISDGLEENEVVASGPNVFDLNDGSKVSFNKSE